MKKFPALGHFANDRKEINEYVPSVNRTFLTLLTDLLLVNIAKEQAGSLGTVHTRRCHLSSRHPHSFTAFGLVGDSLKILRQEVGKHAAVLGFIGAPWTIATYIVEGGTTWTYTVIKSLCHTAPNGWIVDSRDVGALVQTLHQRDHSCSKEKMFRHACCFLHKWKRWRSSADVMDLTRLRYGRWKEAIVEWC
ncbi:hypothetical protein DY000_02055613 [Brassica cretica]|uniref:Uroporphyrinogen decarboxylase (URO-D) domain-containing protein n=1 Tax=Brassica cretica TaxID=69181 RepID=A0ABQ7AG32_BRACR|nr:hypothetical protein DY000_02055613 [Brassica cretica]